jgi:secretion/DNA translocation related TadE-like protein
VRSVRVVASVMVRSAGLRRSARGQAGSATIYVLAVAVALMTLTVVVAGFAGLVAARHRAAAAADLAALAAASAPTDRCVVAATTARHNGARVTECAEQGSDVFVAVSIVARAPLGLRPVVRARARAGPAR